MFLALSSCSEICYEAQKNTSERVYAYGTLKAGGMELQLKRTPSHTILSNLTKDLVAFLKHSCV